MVSPDDYYRATYPVVRSKTQKHFARYPGDEALARRIMEHLHEREVTLPTGGRLTVRRFQQLGFLLGFDEGMETFHSLLESAFCEGTNGPELSLPFLRDLENSQHFETNPIYSEPTAAAIGGMKTWITNEFEHNGLRTDGERVFGRLLDLVRNRV